MKITLRKLIFAGTNFRAFHGFAQKPRNFEPVYDVETAKKIQERALKRRNQEKIKSFGFLRLLRTNIVSESESSSGRFVAKIVFPPNNAEVQLYRYWFENDF